MLSLFDHGVGEEDPLGGLVVLLVVEARYLHHCCDWRICNAREKCRNKAFVLFRVSSVTQGKKATRQSSPSRYELRTSTCGGNEENCFVTSITNNCKAETLAYCLSSWFRNSNHQSATLVSEETIVPRTAMQNRSGGGVVA